jgi:hypothetical protein
MQGYEMALLTSLLGRRDVWKRIAVERLTEPLHLNVIAGLVAVFGGTRAKINFDLLVRPQHAFGLLHAADAAVARGVQCVTVVELGVGAGTGLLNLCALAAKITKMTGVGFDIIGFDTGTGLPPPADFRDHPEIYKQGWFPMGDINALTASLPANARIILGDLKDTIRPFVLTLSPERPVGFVSLDVDHYTSSKQALNLFTGEPSCYFPYVTVYVDDISLPTNTSHAGELLAITEFNAENELRKFDFDGKLVYRRIFKHAEWLIHMYKLHVLDHPERNNLDPPAKIIAVPNPYLSKRI